MNNKPFLTLDDVKRIAAAAEAEALANQWAVCIAVVDDGGHLLWLQRLDGAAPISAQIAPNKARTAALGRRESRVYEEMINQGRVSFLSAPGLEALLEGGVPIMAGRPVHRRGGRQRRQVHRGRADRARRHRRARSRGLTKPGRRWSLGYNFAV